MSREINISGSMTITKFGAHRERLVDFPFTFSFRADMLGSKGPLPGAILVPLAGVDVSLSQLTQPGWCGFHHQGLASGGDLGDDPSIYYVDIGVKDVLTGRFYPMLELQPGWKLPHYFSRNLLESYNQTGTGTGPANNTLHLISHIAPCNVYIGACEA